MNAKIKEIIFVLDKQASDLQNLGRTIEAEMIDSISNSLEEVIAFNKESFQFFDVYGKSFEDYIRGNKFMDPVTRSRVDYKKLPKSMQQLIKKKWEDANSKAVLKHIEDTAEKKNRY